MGRSRGEIKISNSYLSDLTNKYKICLRCLGRVKGNKGSEKLDASIIGMKNISKIIKKKVVNPQSCEFCQGLIEKALDKIPKIVSVLKNYEFDTFLVGCSLASDILKKDNKLSIYNQDYNDLKFEIRKEMGLRILDRLGGEVDFQDPDITVIFNANNLSHTIQVKSLYILGRYTKHIRGIPQTKWPCSSCKGKGCVSCEFTGQQYQKSVESLISSAFILASEAEDASFHGAGREDIDALMLGKGRPFVLELKSPKHRSINLEKLKLQVNKNKDVKIRDLRFSDKSMVVFLKQSSPESSKTYQALVKLAKPINSRNLNSLREFGQEMQIINQQTPLRVSHRRADKIRLKKIYEIDVNLLNHTNLKLNIRAQGGAYIKEFISGDQGRTNPSVSSILGINSKCEKLDVIAVDDRGVFE